MKNISFPWNSSESTTVLQYAETSNSENYKPFPTSPQNSLESDLFNESSIQKCLFGMDSVKSRRMSHDLMERKGRHEHATRDGRVDRTTRKSEVL